MTEERFRAKVQYGDFEGTSSADRADRGGPQDFLRAQGLLEEGDFIAGIEVWTGENHGVHRDPITVHFLLSKGSFDSTKASIDKASGPVPLRRITADMPVSDFMGLFKRFSLCLSPGGMLNDRTYTCSE